MEKEARPMIGVTCLLCGAKFRAKIVALGGGFACRSHCGLCDGSLSTWWRLVTPWDAMNQRCEADDIAEKQAD